MAVVSVPVLADTRHLPQHVSRKDRKGNRLSSGVRLPVTVDLTTAATERLLEVDSEDLRAVIMVDLLAAVSVVLRGPVMADLPVVALVGLPAGATLDLQAAALAAALADLDMERNLLMQGRSLLQRPRRLQVRLRRQGRLPYQQPRGKVQLLRTAIHGAAVLVPGLMARAVMAQVASVQAAMARLVLVRVAMVRATMVVPATAPNGRAERAVSIRRT